MARPVGPGLNFDFRASVPQVRLTARWPLFGAWRLAAEHPELFAAVVPICSGMPDLKSFLLRLPALVGKPIWVFHGAQDDVAPIADSDRIVAELRSLGSDVRYTIYPDSGHNSWSPAYA